jgi:hypothetical protein
MLKYKLLTSLIGVILMTVPLIVNVSASTGMGGDPPGKGQDNPQPDRVGNEDEKDRDGPGGESAEGDDGGEAKTKTILPIMRTALVARSQTKSVQKTNQHFSFLFF